MTAAPHSVETPEEPMAHRTRLLRPMAAELDFLRATSDRSDPLAEALLSVVEAAVLAADAVRRVRTCTGSPDVHDHLRDVLAAARAAVTAANFAVIEAKDAEADARKRTAEPRPALPR